MRLEEWFWSVTVLGLACAAGMVFYTFEGWFRFAYAFLLACVSMATLSMKFQYASNISYTNIRGKDGEA